MNFIQKHIVMQPQFIVKDIDNWYEYFVNVYKRMFR